LLSSKGAVAAGKASPVQGTRRGAAVAHPAEVASKGKGKGNGKGKGKGSSAKGGAPGEVPSRKERRKLSKGKGKGKGAGAPGHGKGQGEKVEKKTSATDTAAALKKKRERQKEKRKKKGKHAACAGLPDAPKPKQEVKPDLMAALAPELKCKRGHAMCRRSQNPRGYKNLAGCDSCGLAKLPKKRDHFFHCSFCRFDLCPQCAAKRDPRGDERGKKRKREDMDRPRAAGRGSRGDAAGGEEPGFNRERREIWLPTEETAVSRAPIKSVVVADWIEGVPA